MRPVPITLVMLAVAGASSSSFSADASDAVSGVVRSSHTDGSIVWLDLDDAKETRIALVVGWLSNFPSDPSGAYLGQTITVRGTTTSFRGKREIQVHDAQDITVIGARGPAAAPQTSDVQALREQVRQLNERIDELEHPAGP